MHCLFSIQFQIIITPVVIFKLLVNVLPVLPSATDSNYLCDFFKLLVNVLSFLPSVTDSNYPCGVFKLLVNVLSVFPSATDSNYLFDFFKLLVMYCLFSLQLQILIISVVSSNLW